jgi:hypothetical protein
VNDTGAHGAHATGNVVIMTEPSEGGPERDRITDPGVPERLAETADAEQRTLMHQIAVSTAESVVAEARGRDADIAARGPDQQN